MVRPKNVAVRAPSVVPDHLRMRASAYAKFRLTWSGVKYNVKGVPVVPPVVYRISLLPLYLIDTKSLGLALTSSLVISGKQAMSFTDFISDGLKPILRQSLA